MRIGKRIVTLLEEMMPEFLRQQRKFMY